MNDKLRIVLKTLAVVLFLVSIAIIGITAIKNHMRKDISKDAIKVVESAIEEGGDKKVTFEVPVSDFYKVDGEWGEDDASLQDLLREMTDLSSQHETLTLIGILAEVLVAFHAETADDVGLRVAIVYFDRFPPRLGPEGDPREADQQEAGNLAYHLTVIYNSLFSSSFLRVLFW